MSNTKRSVLVCASVAALSLAVAAGGGRSSSAGRDTLKIGLIHWWPFYGNTADQAGNLNAAAQGPISYTEVGAGMGIVFNGKTTGISLPPTPEMQFQGSFSISVWANLYSRPAASQMWSSIIFDGDDRPGLDPYALQADPKGNIQFLVTGKKNLGAIDAPLPLKTFVYLTATYDQANGVQRLYENGKLMGEKLGDTTFTPVCGLVDGQQAGLGIGTNNGFPNSYLNFGWNGVISDLRVYARPLTQYEVTQLYHQGVTAPVGATKTINP